MIGVLSLAGFALASANEKVTTVDGKEVVQAYNNLINKKGIDALVYSFFASINRTCNLNI